MSSVPALPRNQAATVLPATLVDGLARADLARGQRAYGRALAATTDEGGSRGAMLLPRYGFARFALPPNVLLLAGTFDEDGETATPGRPEAHAAYGEAARRGRIDIPSGDLIDLSV